MSVVLQLLYDIKVPSWIPGNTMIPALNEPVYISDGRYAFGDGVTQVQSLTFFGGAGGSGTVTSIDASATGALSFSGGPITGAGTLALAWAGSSSQYVLGDGSLATLNSNSKTIALVGKPILIGDSITAGAGPSPGYYAYTQCVARQNARINAALSFTNLAIGGNGVLLCALSAFANFPLIGNLNSVLIMAGLNDINRAGAPAATLLKVAGCYRAMIVNAWLKLGRAASAVTNTGTWSNFTTLNGKSVALGGNSRQSSTAGDTLTYSNTIDTNSLVIGTFNTDGVTNNWGRFTVSVDGTLLATFDPNGRTDGVTDGIWNNKITPEALVFNITWVTLTITLLDNKPTVIDYIGSLTAPEASPGILVIDSPHCTAAGYASYAGGLGSDAAMDALNSTVQGVIDEFSNYSICRSLTNNSYDPTTGASADGVHPNNPGSQKIADEIQKELRPQIAILSQDVDQIASSNPVFVMTDLSRAANLRKFYFTNEGGDWIFARVNDALTSRTINLTMLNSGGVMVPSIQIGASTTGYVWTATDAIGNGSWQAASSGAPSLTSTYVGYGDGSNLLTGAATMTFDTSGLNVGNATRTNQRYLRIGQGSAWVDFGSIVGFPSYGAMYINQTPAFNNYAIIGDVGLTQMNSTGTVQFSISDNVKVGLTVSEFQLVSGVNLRLGNAFTAGAPTNTTVGYVTMKDSGGNLVQVVCWK